MMHFLRCCMCRQFRTSFLLALAVTFIFQSLFVLYLLTKVSLKDSEIPTEFGSFQSAKTHLQEEPELLRPPNCEALGKTALSAIKRATTTKCKEELKSIACLLKNTKLTPERLPNSCLREGAVPGGFLGCFSDAGDQQSRLLSSYGVKLSQLTVQKCLDVCAQSSYPYAGVHNGKECYCGVHKPSLEQLLARDTYCNVLCDGQPSGGRQTCGGVDATEVFDTGVPTRQSIKLLDPLPLMVSNGTGSVRIAFILTLNGRALRQVKRLLRIIYRPHHVYLIHVDGRQDYLFRNLLALELKYPNIRLTRKRHASIWGGASLLDVILEALEQLLEMDSRWQFAFNLSESDFLLRSIEDLESLLAANPGRNFLKSHGRQTRQFIHKQGLDRVFHQCEGRMWRLGDRSLPAGIRIDGGSDWIGVTRQLAQYATGMSANGVKGESDSLLKGLKELYKHTLLPAESFFHVLVLNSRFCDTFVDNNLRMTLWRRSQGCLCQHKHVVDWCGCSPMVFRTGDWSQLLSVMAKSPTIFFARKFESSIDQSVMNRLEEKFVANASLAYPGWDSYWENAYHVADVTPRPHPALIAVTKSLARHALALLTSSSQLKPTDVCSSFPKPDRIVSVTSYFRLDHYQGDLILFEAGGETQFEALVKPLAKSKILPKSGSPSTRFLASIQIGSDYDPKEQVLRNRLGVLSSDAKPVTVLRWATQQHSVDINQTGGLNQNSSSETAHLVWFDPDDHVRFIHAVNISDNSKAGHYTLELESVLAPGVWTAVVVHDGNSLGVTEFLIPPLVSDDSFPSPIDLVKRAKDSALQEEQWIKYLPGDGPAVSRRQRRRALVAQGNGNEASLDALTSEFYAIQDVCFLTLSKRSCGQPPAEWQSCTKTDWSSLSPDPKSSLP